MTARASSLFPVASALALLMLAGCSSGARPASTAPPTTSAAEVARAPATTAPAAAASSAAPASALPPPTPRKAGCLDSTRGAKHTFVGKLEKHPDGSGNVRVLLPKKVCFGGGRFSAGETQEIILDVEESRAKPLLAKKVKVVGTSQDFAPGKAHAYVLNLQVESLSPAK